jgi:UDP-N-acetylmuramoylalanine--D-glutamate ligase
LLNFKPHIAIITNITPDHLDRYDNKFENYIASKFRIAKNQTNEDYFIYDADDEVIRNWLEKNPVQSKLLPFSLVKTIENGALFKNKIITITIDNKQITMPTSNLTFRRKTQH